MIRIEELNRICRGSLIELLDIEFTGYSDTTMEAVMHVSPKLYQPMGVVHGGALISLAETVGSAGSFLFVDPEDYDVLGAVVNSQHMAPAREGTLHATARLAYKSENKHVWDVEIVDDSGKLISMSRVTNAIKPKKQGAPR